MIRRYVLLFGVLAGTVSPVSQSAAQTPTNIPPAIVQAAHYLAERLGVPRDRVEVVSVERVVWPDGCLGLPAREACLPVSTPGYRAILRVDNAQYRIHTDRQSSFRFAESRIP